MNQAAVAVIQMMQIVNTILRINALLTEMINEHILNTVTGIIHDQRVLNTGKGAHATAVVNVAIVEIQRNQMIHIREIQQRVAMIVVTIVIAVVVITANTNSVTPKVLPEVGVVVTHGCNHNNSQRVTLIITAQDTL